MSYKWTCGALALALLTGCVSQSEYVPKTDEQIAQESLDNTISDMRQRGASQAEIDKFVAYQKMSFEDQLKSTISPNSSPAENLVGLINKGLFYCDLRRSSLKRPITYEYTAKLRRELMECISSSSQVITSYYYNSYASANSSEAVKAAVDETYLKWGSYKNSIFQSAPSYMQDQASLSLKDYISRSEQVFFKEVLAKQKKK